MLADMSGNSGEVPHWFWRLIVHPAACTRARMPVKGPAGHMPGTPGNQQLTVLYCSIARACAARCRLAWAGSSPSLNSSLCSNCQNELECQLSYSIIFIELAVEKDSLMPALTPGHGLIRFNLRATHFLNLSQAGELKRCITPVVTWALS